MPNEQGRVYTLQGAAALPVTVTKKRVDVEKTVNVTFLMPYNCSKILLTLCKLDISSTEARTGEGMGVKPPNTISLPNIMNRIQPPK